MHRYSLLSIKILLRRWRSGLKFRWALGKQVLSLERSLASIVTLYHHLDARAEDIWNDAVVSYWQPLCTLRDDKGDKLLLVITHNRTLLHHASNAHRLRSTGGTVPEFAHRHIVDSVRLCIGVHEVDYRCQNSQSANDKTERQPFTPSRRNLLFSWCCRSRLHTLTPMYQSVGCDRSLK